MRRWPAEWEPHAATIVAWPDRAEVWGSWLHAVQLEMRAAILEVCRHERVILIARREDHARLGDELAPVADRVDLLVIPTDDVWTRDSAPTLVLDGSAVRAVDWNFGAWGGKFTHENDGQLAGRIADWLRVGRDVSRLVLEGGALETNGEGRVICTRSVALDPNRNPEASERSATDEIRRQTGATEVIWLRSGMSTDDTDGHVDTLARFVSRDRVLFQRLPPDDWEAERANERSLIDAGLELVELPRPELAGVPASYANCYWTNGAVLVPTYGVAADDRACEIISEVVDRPVVPIRCRALVTQGGAIHCATQQVPLG